MSLSWQPPASTMRSSGVAFGATELNEAAERMRPRPLSSSEAGWLLWAAAPDRDGRTVTFRDRKRLAPGLAVVAEGVVPLYARRADGSVLHASGVPLAEPMPAWLVDALGSGWQQAAT